MSPRRFVHFAVWTAIFLALFLFWEQPRERSISDPPSEENAASEPSTVGDADRTHPEGEPAPRAPQHDRIAAPAADEASPELARIAGRCVDARGNAIDGAALELSLTPSSSRAGETLRTASDREGRFRFDFDVAGLASWKLAAHGSGPERHCWSWSSSPSSLQCDLGDLRLGGDHALHVSVVDGVGRPLSARWNFEVDYGGLASAHGGLRTVELACGEPCAEAVISGLPDRPALVRARHASLDLVAEGAVEIAADRTAHAVLRYGPALSSRHRLWLRLHCRHALPEHRKQTARITLTAPDGTRVQREIAASHPVGCVIDDLPFAPHALRIEHPCFRTHETIEVFPTKSHDVELAGSAELELDVRDEEGQPVSEFALDLRYALQKPGSYDTVRRRSLDEPLPAGSIFDRIVHGEITAIVSAPEYAPVEALLGTVTANERRKVSIEFSQGSTIRGVVLNGAGEAVPQCTVVLGPRFPEELSAMRLFRGAELDRARHQRTEIATDAQGRFEIEHLRASACWIATRTEDRIQAEEQLVLGANETREIVLRLPSLGHFVGRLVGHAGELPTNLAVRAVDHEIEGVPLESRGFPSNSSIDAEHRFRFGPLPIGSYRFILALPPYQHTAGQVPSQARLAAHEVELGSAMIGPGVNEEQTFDLSRIGFGSLEVTLQVNGAIPEGSILVLRMAPGESRDTAIAADLRADGRASFPLVPSGSWKLIAKPPRMSGFEHDEPVVIAPNLTSRVSIDVATRADSVRILDRASGAPHAEAWVSIDEGLFRRPLRTDAQGSLLLDLAPGTYRVHIRVGGEMRHPLGPPELLHWTAAGPVEHELRF